MQRNRIWHQRMACGLSLLGFCLPLLAEDAPNPAPLTEAAARLKLPQGFTATLFAGEPDVIQPIAMNFDDRGRLWVAECFSYPDWKPEGKDRLVIFEDRDGDGKFDTRKVFWEGGRYLTGFALGYGGVWIADAPDLAFIPDADGNDEPDGPPVVHLDGWSYKGRHNVLNALTWGPDGWMYGCNGITSPSNVGKPGTPDDQRVPLNCGVWRYHPVQHRFEVVAQGTTNPWGLDFDATGQMFITNCVIAHLWHVVPGARFERMFGSDSNPQAYQLMKSCADHLHWGGGHWTDSRSGQGKHDEAGGGHAHAGCMIYLADNWPKNYFNTLFTVNIHGRRVNNDVLARQDSSYVATHGKDLIFSADPWFRGLEMRYGPDGSVMLSDWSDTGECHDYTNTQRQTGRLFRIHYGDLKPVKVNLAAESNEDLVDRLTHANAWYRRHARRLLQERAAAEQNLSGIHTALLLMLRVEENAVHRLEALWTLYATQGLGDRVLQELTRDPMEEIRAWAVRLEADDAQVPPPSLRRWVEMAATEPSGQVRLELASALQKLEPERRWDLAKGLLSRAEDAQDTNLSLLLWYGIEPLVPADPARAAELLAGARWPIVRQNIARRLAASIQD